MRLSSSRVPGGSPRPHRHGPAAAPRAACARASWTAGSPSSPSSSSRCSASSKRPRHTSAVSAGAPHKARLDRKPQGQALLEALTRDGQATIDLSGLHVSHGEPTGGRRPRGRPCPLPGPRLRPAPAPRARRRCGRGRSTGEGSQVEGIHLGFDAPRAPGGVDGSLLRLRHCRRSGHAGTGTATGRSGHSASSSVGESPAYSTARRIASCLPTVVLGRRRDGRARSRREQASNRSGSGPSMSTAVRTRVYPRSSSPCSPAASPRRTTISACGWPATASASGTRSHSDSARSSWVRASAARQSLRRQSGADRRRQGPGQVVGGVPVEGEPAQRRHPGIGFGVDPGLEDLGQPGVDPGPFVGHQVVVGRLTQQRVPELQGPGGLAQHVGVQRLPQIALHLGLVESRQLGERLGVQPGPVDRGQAEQRPRALVEGVDPGQQQIGQVIGDPLLAGVWSAARSSSAYSGLPSDRASTASTSDGSGGPSVWAATMPAMSARSNPPRSMRRDPGVRLISVNVFRNGWRRWSSSLRKVSTNSSAPRAVRDSAAAKSWVERSAQCMSSSTTSTGPAAAASSTTAVRSSNTCNASRLRGASGSSRVSIRRADGRDPRSSIPVSSAPHRLDHRGERHAGLDVETVPRRHGEPQPGRPAFEVRHQGGLPDPGVAPDE